MPIELVKKQTIDEVVDAIARSGELASVLKVWYRRNFKLNPTVNYAAWERGLTIDLASNVPEATVENIVAAIRINAIGDRIACRLSRKAELEGYDTDINCYVEEGIVYANVWVHGKTADGNKAKADEIAAEFRKEGYAAEVWVDELDSKDVTVNAQIDFPLYVGKKGEK